MVSLTCAGCPSTVTVAMLLTSVIPQGKADL